MTILRVTLAGVVLEAEQKAALARRLIENFAEVEVGHAAPAVRNGFVVQIQHAAVDDVFMGDAPMAGAGPASRCALVSAHVMAGPWNDAMKAELFERIDRVVREAAGMPREGAGSDVWITFVEVPEGGWGVGGRPVSIARLAAVFDEERQARIRSYLASLGASGSLDSSR